jgi:hypothetical protein
MGRDVPGPRMLPALLLLGTLALLTGCATTPASSGEDPPAQLPPLQLTPIQPLEPVPGATGVSLLPTFAWTIPRKPNRVDTILFNLYRDSDTEGQADFIRVFDGPIDRFRLDQGQEGMPVLGIGPLESDTSYLWRLSITYTDTADVHVGEWHFRTGSR